MKRSCKFLLIFIVCCSFQSSEAILLKWNFKNFTTLTFSYDQTLTLTANMFGKQITETSGKGILVVTVNNQDSADIILKNVISKISEIDSLGNKRQIMESPMPELVISGIRDNGTIAGKLNSQTETLSKVLFPITNNELLLNAEFDLPLEMSFNYFGTSIKTTGHNKVKNIGKGQLSTIIDVSHIEDVKDAAKYVCYLKGTSNYLFNNEKGYFTEGKIYIEMFLGTLENGQRVDSMSAISTIDLKLITKE